MDKNATNALPVGRFLNNGRYRIVQVLGEGGYGIIYEALDLHKRQKVAIKEFFPTYAVLRSSNRTDAVCISPKHGKALAHARMRFNEEAALLYALRNIKEIVNIYHSFEDNQTAYYTMELLQGMDMQKWLKTHGRMHWHELSPIVIQILRALYSTHQMGFVHRDITPDNIFLLNDGTVQLIDFGNARRYKENQQLTAVVKDKFAPREQYSRKGRQGPWTDIYSLCVTIYYVLTGVLPKKATERVSEADALPQLHMVAQVPPEVSKAVQIGMSADENKRYQSIADFAYALYPGQAIFGGITPMASNPQVPENQEFPKTNPDSGLALVCTQGLMRGFHLNLPVGQIQTIGRGQGKIIQYPDETVGVSRSQCSILLQANGIVYIKDDRSRFGTVVNGQRLVSDSWKVLKKGDSIAFGRERFVLY